MMKRHHLIALVLVFYGLILGLGALCNWLAGQPVMPPGLRGDLNWPWLAQTMTLGLLGGGAMAVLGSKLKALKRLYEILDGLFEPTGLVDLFLVSLLAGVCEEYLFRFSLVPLLGGIGSTLLFAAAHGALDIRKAWQRAYLIFLLLAGWGLYAVFMKWGLLTAMVLHFAFDLGFLLVLRVGRPKKKGCPLPDSP